MKKIFTTICIIVSLFTLAISQTSVEFIVSGIPEKIGKNVGIRGDKPPLNWDTSIRMHKTGEAYSVTVDFPERTENIEFKFVLFDSDKKPVWEGTENRSLLLKANEKMSSNSEWDVEQMVDIATLPLLSPEELLADYQLIETMVLQVHPGTFRYNDSLSIRQALVELKASFQTPLTYGDCYLAISKLLASLQCGHTFASFYNQNKTIKSVIHRQKDKLPFTFKWLDEKMIVIYDATEKQQLARGMEILSINSVPVATIQTTVMPYISADGATDKSRIASMEIAGFDFRYDDFDVFYPLLFPMKTDSITLKTKAYGNEEKVQKKVAVVTRADRNKQLVERYPEFPKTRDELWHFEIREDNIGVLTLNSFGLMGWKRLTINYKQFLADAFEMLKKQEVKQLIIDIRKNNGGNDEMAEELLTYFNIDRITEVETEGRTRYLEFPEILKPYVQSWGEPWYFNLKPDREDTENGYYIFEKVFFLDQSNKKKRNVFKGDIYFLISPANASLAYYLPKGVRKYKAGTLVGQETGGNLRGINGGQILFLRLPGSQIEIDVPVMGGFAIKEEPNHGVLPDIEVKPTIADIYNGVDTEMKAVLKLIK